MTDKESKLMLIGAALRDLSEGSNAVEGLLLNTSPSKEASKHTFVVTVDSHLPSFIKPVK